jgi:hypothetical protein
VRIAGHGIALDLPRGWEGRIVRLAGGPPTLHAANFPLPVEDSDFATGAVAQMPADGVLVVLTEYERDLARTALFAHEGIPRPLPADAVRSESLLRRLPGQAGVQRFFTHAGRAFCLYVVVGALPSRPELVGRANAILGTVAIERGSA